jgi:hypothetical protein
MSLLTIAEVLSGETLVSSGGPVDRLTAAADDVLLWQFCVPLLVGLAQQEPALV